MVLHLLRSRYSPLSSRLRTPKFAALMSVAVTLQLATSTSTIAQAPGEKDYHFQSESKLVIVPIVVRDKNGQVVTGLTRDDFKVFDQGKRQTITQFEEESGRLASQSPASATPQSTQGPSAANATLRFVAIVFDDLNTSAEDMIHARDALSSLIASGLPAGDRIAIFNSRELLSSFTDDQAQLQAALGRVHSSGVNQSAVHECPDISDFEAQELLDTNDLDSNAWRTAAAEYRACSGIYSPSSSRQNPLPDQVLITIRMRAKQILDFSQMLARDNLQQLDSVVAYIAKAPGTRSVISVSPGFLSQSEQLSLDRIIEKGLRDEVVINTIDPKGVFLGKRGAHASQSITALPDPQASLARETLNSQKEFVGSDVLAELAQGTGGLFLHNDNDLRAGLAAITSPPRYILAFSPTDVKENGSFHAIKVTFAEKKRGYSIQARRGYYTATVTPGKAKPNEALVASTSPSPEMHPVADATATSTPATPASSESRTSASPEVTENLSPTPSPGPNSRQPGPAVSTPKSAKKHHVLGGKTSMTIAQLQQLLSSSKAHSDSALARRLTNAELSERLDDATFARLSTTLPGAESKSVFRILSDESAFQPPPAASLPHEPAPDEAVQKQWIAAASRYVSSTLSQLPNFFATRKVSSFADSPASQFNGFYSNYQPVHATVESTSTVLYRGGKEVIDANTGTMRRERSVASGGSLNTYGEFGPLLGIVLNDALHSNLSWDHWEAGQSGSVAVFDYSVPRNKSHYEVEFCCVDLGMGSQVYRQISEYNGEISVDPATGAVLRLTIVPHLKPSHPLERADMVIDYGSVSIGGIKYVCPIHSVTISVAVVPASFDLGAVTPESTSHEVGQTRTGAPGRASNQDASADDTVRIFMNETNFVDYHVFRSDSRLIPASVSEPK